MSDYEDVEARLRERKTFFRNGAAWLMAPEPDTDCIKGADTIATLRRQRGEAQADVERLTRERGEWRTSLKECSDDLAEMVANQYPNRNRYPSEKRRYDRDMEPVLLARVLQAKHA